MTYGRDAKITVGLPVKNAESFLDRALMGLRNQTYGDISIIVSDNSSTDDTVRIALSHAESDSRVSVIRQATDIGAARNFETVLSEASSPYFMWAAHDDWWDSTLIEKSVRYLDSGSSYVVPNWWVGDLNRRRGTSAHANPLGFLEHPSPRNRLLQYVNLHHATHKCNLVYSVFRRDFLVESVGLQGLENDGLFGAVVAHRSSGTTLDEILFYKHFSAPRLTNMLKKVSPRIRLRSSAKKFESAKEFARVGHLRKFPSVEREINEIFDHYSFSKPRSGRILNIESL